MYFPVSEYFTGFQGEGKFTGSYCLFIRFADCNFACPFCDTVDRIGKTNFQLTLNNILDLIKEGNHRHIVLTGGEPCLYSEHLLKLGETLSSKKVFVEVETNGSLPIVDPDCFLKEWHFNISPKVWNADAYEKLFSPKKRIYKFPLSQQNYEATVTFMGTYGLLAEEIYVTPLGASREEYEKEWKFVYEKALQHHWNFSSRLQILHGFR